MQFVEYLALLAIGLPLASAAPLAADVKAIAAKESSSLARDREAAYTANLFVPRSETAMEHVYSAEDRELEDVRALAPWPRRETAKESIATILTRAYEEGRIEFVPRGEAAKVSHDSAQKAAAHDANVRISARREGFQEAHDLGQIHDGKEAKARLIPRGEAAMDALDIDGAPVKDVDVREKIAAPKMLAAEILARIEAALHANPKPIDVVSKAQLERQGVASKRDRAVAEALDLDQPRDKDVQVKSAAPRIDKAVEVARHDQELDANVKENKLTAKNHLGKEDAVVDRERVAANNYAKDGKEGVNQKQKQKQKQNSNF